MISTATTIVEDAEKEKLESLFQNAELEIVSQGRFASALATLVANIDILNNKFVDNQREQLSKILVPTFKVLKEDFNVHQFQYHTPPATSFLRLHKPEKFGDDLSSFRNTVVVANTTKNNVLGLEQGVAGLGIRGVSPVYHENKHIGSVEFGMSFGQSFFDNFKQKYNVDISLYINKSNNFEKFGSTMPNNSLLKNSELMSALTTPTITQRNIQGQEFTVYAHKVSDYEGKTIGVIEIAMDRSHYANSIASVRNTAILVGLASLLIGICVAIYISKIITRPLNIAVNTMNEIAQNGGDLTLRLKVEGDNEISELAKAFNLFTEKVHSIVSQVSNSTVQLSSAAHEMSKVMEETNSNTSQQQSKVSQVITAMNEMESAVNEIARNTAQASSAANNADIASCDGKTLVGNTMKAIEALASKLDSATNVIIQLEQDSDKIGTVLDVIKGIADQTNLLALNAAIEAARAGEQGRGFAVVADEVRTLASKTQQSTQEIQSMISALQEGSRSAVNAMSDSRAQSQSSVELSVDAVASIEAIRVSVSSIKDMNTQMATVAEEQSLVTKEVSSNILKIGDISKHSVEGVTQATMATEELAKLAIELQATVNKFKL